MGFQRRVSVDVLVGQGLLAQSGALCAEVGIKGKVAIITHPQLQELYGGVLKESLERASIKGIFVVIPPGEASKDWTTLAKILPILRGEGFDRSCAVASMGGGVAGDVAGFLASIYMRGLPLIHLPTTLLAQVDSALGGKTAANFQGAKNLLGSFYQPRLILADTGGY